MAQKRMLNKSISLSRKVNKLSIKNELIYVLCIPHLDDFGLVSSDSSVIKAMVFPMRKDITESDIKKFIEVAQEIDESGESLIEEYKDCLFFTAFEDHQSISAEKRAKSRFSKIPKNPQENIGENKNPQKSPVQEKLSKEKLREEKGSADAYSPKEFFEEAYVEPRTERYKNFVNGFVTQKEYLKNLQIHRLIVDEFIPHWREGSDAGKKELWERQPVFDVKKRVATWISNYHKFKKDWQCKNGRWHEKEERCLCVKAPPKPPEPESSPQEKEKAKEIAKSVNSLTKNLSIGRSS